MQTAELDAIRAEMRAPRVSRQDEVLTPEALGFLSELHRRFDGRRKALLKARQTRQARYDAGELPDFRTDTLDIRQGDWRVAPAPHDLRDRRVEITGPVDRKMVINALNSGARVFMADFEDATAPTWANMIEGQVNLKDLWAGTLSFDDPRTGKAYRLGPQRAVLKVRPRGWHLDEAHVRVGGEAISGALFDLGLYLFHNARAALDQGSGPYAYLPKLESFEEAALWNDVLGHVEQRLGLSHGAVRVTVLIETLPAAFEMDEILYALRERIVGLNCGRWDYIFSTIKCLSADARFITPDRARMVMGEAFLRAYSLRLIETCHRRGAHAMGGMAAQIPVRGDEAANAAALAKVRADKMREARDGHDGTWVAHPDLVPVAMAVFDEIMPSASQFERRHDLGDLDRDALLSLHEGTRTEAGLRGNIRVAILYIAAWLSGRGAVPIDNLMEDAATAEICRAQLWQWRVHGATLEDGRVVDEALIADLIAEETAGLADPPAHLDAAVRLFTDLVMAERLEPFLTGPAYKVLSAA